MEKHLRRAAHKTVKPESAMTVFMRGEGKHLAIKAGLILVLILFLVVIYGRDGAADVDLGELRGTIKESCDMGDLKSTKDRDLMQFMGLNAENYEDSYFYLKSREALAVEELLVIKTHNVNKLDAAKDACEGRIDSQINTYKGYGVEQVRMLEQATLFTKGDYLFYSVGDNSREYEEVFRRAVQ